MIAVASVPTVSVIMAAYNGAALIGETLDSLFAQSFADFEIIVVDDCSTDDTLGVLRGYDDPRLIVVASEVNQGPVRTRNHGFALARGRYFAALDQDDLCHVDRFARQVAYLDAHPDVVLVASAAAQLMGGQILPGRPLGRTTPALISWLIKLENPLIWSSVMFRADSARRLGTVTRPEILYAEDFDLYHRLSRLGALARIDDELVTYRRHAEGASRRYEAIMIANAGQVLTEAYRPLFGDDAEEYGRLVSRHILDGQPIVNSLAMRRLSFVIKTLRDEALARPGIDAESVALIRRQASRLWWQVARHAIRSGKVAVGGVIAARPDGVAFGDSSPRSLLRAGLVGRGRALLRRNAG